MHLDLKPANVMLDGIPFDSRGLYDGITVCEVYPLRSEVSHVPRAARTRCRACTETSSQPI